MTRYLILMLFVFFELNLFSIKKAKYTYDEYTIGFINYIDENNSKNALKNLNGVSIISSFYKSNNLYFSAKLKYENATNSRDLYFSNYYIPINSKIYFSSAELNIGYCIYILDNFSICPYTGYIESYFNISSKDGNYEKKYWKMGLPVGLKINVFYRISEKLPYFVLVYYNTGLNYRRMNEINSAFGNKFFLSEFGIGIMKDLIKKKKRIKKDN